MAVMVLLGLQVWPVRSAVLNLDDEAVKTRFLFCLFLFCIWFEAIIANTSYITEYLLTKSFLALAFDSDNGEPDRVLPASYTARCPSRPTRYMNATKWPHPNFLLAQYPEALSVQPL